MEFASTAVAVERHIKHFTWPGEVASGKRWPGGLSNWSAWLAQWTHTGEVRQPPPVEFRGFFAGAARQGHANFSKALLPCSPCIHPFSSICALHWRGDGSILSLPGKPLPLHPFHACSRTGSCATSRHMQQVRTPSSRSWAAGVEAESMCSQLAGQVRMFYVWWHSYGSGCIPRALPLKVC